MEPIDRTAPNNATERGFSRIDLTVVVAVLAIGFALLLPALRQSSNYSGTMVGGSNMKRLTAAWYLYAIDNGEKLPPTRDGGQSGLVSNKLSWVAGWFTYDNQNTHNTNTSYLTQPYGLRGGFPTGETNRQTGGTILHYGGLLGAYESDPLLFRNPNDPSYMVAINGQSLPRVRSVSMNLMLGAIASQGLDGFVNNNVGGGYRAFPRLSSFAGMSPSSTFVLIEEHPDSLNDGNFVVDLGNPQNMVDWTGNFSNGGFWISFADGRVDLWRFRGESFHKPMLRTFGATISLSQEEQSLFRRVQSATSSR